VTAAETTRSSRFRNLQQLSRREGVGRMLNYVCRRLNIDLKFGRRVSILLKSLRHPVERLRRSRIGRLAEQSEEIRVVRGVDYVAIPPGGLPGTDDLIRELRALFQRKKDKVLANYAPPLAEFLETESTPDGPRLVDVRDFEPIMRFASQPQLLRIVADYLGQVPVLSGASFSHTLPGQSMIGSQLFHNDMNDPLHLHLVMPIETIDDECGPFTFLPSEISERVMKTLNYRTGRLTDEEVFTVAKPSDVVRATGEPGTIYLVNPCSCLHYGARATSKTRTVLFLNFARFCEGIEGQCGVYRAVNRHELDNGDPLRRMLLRL